MAAAHGQPGLHPPPADLARAAWRLHLREALTIGLQPLSVVADKAYGTDKLRAHWQARGIGVCIPPKSSRLVQHLYSKVLYRTRHMVENSFCRLKDNRRLSL